MSSCNAEAIAAAFEFGVDKKGLPSFSPSRLFIWYHAREKSSDPSAVLKNKGCSMRDAIKSLDFAAHGVCPEEDWPFKECKYDHKTRLFAPNERAARKPPVRAAKHAHDHTASRYYTFSEPNLRKKLIQCLDNGYPIVFGMKTYGLLSTKNIDSNGEGLRVPTSRDQKKDEGRHGVMMVGYVESDRVFLVRNSWGTKFGKRGYFLMPYDYLEHCQNFWTIRVDSS
ncbi:hypothetical protein B0H16DRAFT_1677792 [Mycena metata]|uniref:Peptidase C1A papain C-terminal domain-containing protein n=1 Tax=Mycena metata TaxID=1033252 RepID=A0AAD7MLA2_9AGAR|nr:hypothetical protein B0H16DRAFT_1677792 [Mycena metata]